MMVVNIIIPTYNGAKKIGNLLAALAKQSYSDFQVLVVIDGSNDGTEQIVQAYESVLEIRCFGQQNKGRSGAKNRGASEASGELLIFYDDDVIPDLDSVEKHLKFHTSAGGQFILSGNIIETTESRKTDIQKFKAYLVAGWVKMYRDGVTRLEEKNLMLTSANCSMKKTAFDKLGGFNEQLRDAEDYDLALRAHQIGFGLYYDKSNNALHNDPITCRTYIKRQRQYRAAHQQLRKLHPDKDLRRLNQSKGILSKLKKFWYFLFAFTFWVRLIDKDVLKFFLPRYARYKLYAWVIHSLSVMYPRVSL